MKAEISQAADRWDGMSPLERAAVRWVQLDNLCAEIEAEMLRTWPCSDPDYFLRWCPDQVLDEEYCFNCARRARMREILLWLRTRRGVALRDLRKKAGGP